MNRIFYNYNYIATVFWVVFICTMLVADSQKCSICNHPLRSDYSVDAWGNAFHSEHEKEGLFCHSCSRIISQGVTGGGYIYSDGRHICSLCHISAIDGDSLIQSAYKSVLTQLFEIGISNIPLNIAIELIDLNLLNEMAGDNFHAKLKGFTYFEPMDDSIIPLTNPYRIYLLNGLPRTEFEAVLAHELLHVWLHLNNIKLNLKKTEGFCNLGSYLIYANEGTRFSSIHLKAMEEDSDEIYGSGFRYMKSLLLEIGWEKLLIKVRGMAE